MKKMTRDCHTASRVFTQKCHALYVWGGDRKKALVIVKYLNEQ